MSAGYKQEVARCRRCQPPSDERHGAVYVARSVEHPSVYKIGSTLRSRDLWRYRIVEVGRYYRSEFEPVCFIPSRDARRLERLIHRSLRRYLYNKEPSGPRELFRLPGVIVDALRGAPPACCIGGMSARELLAACERHGIAVAALKGRKR